jgi:hypothetical protein
LCGGKAKAGVEIKSSFEERLVVVGSQGAEDLEDYLKKRHFLQHAVRLRASRLLVMALWTALAFSVVLVLVVALDRPHQHLSTATQAAMFDLQEDIRRSMQSQP